MTLGNGNGTDPREAEARRLFEAIKQPDRWSMEECRQVAPMTMAINRLKRERNAVILAHSYQTPDIVYGVADHVGDSYGLSKVAARSDADIIVFASVRFMAETAKIVNPGRTVLIPEPDAGCSLADGVTVEDVKRYRRDYPRAAIVAYVNTSADVKALADVCVTSSNYLEIARSLPQDQIVFLPDRYMGAHLRAQLVGQKEVIVHDAVCVVHEAFRPETATTWRDQVARSGRQLLIMAHPECAPNVLAEADFVGSTEAMMDYARNLDGSSPVDIMPITECGTADRMKAEIPNIRVHGTCSECPYMKRTDLAKILQVLEAPRPDQEIRIEPGTLQDAGRALERMFALAEPAA